MTSHNLAITGTVTIAPWLRTSKAGKNYCNFTIMTKTGLTDCVAFGNNAIMLDSRAKLGIEVVVSGTMKDSKLFVESWSIPSLEPTTAAQKGLNPTPKLVDEPKTEIDLLMDALGAGYVNRRFKEVFEGRKLTSLGSFPLQKYHDLILELTQLAHSKEDGR